MRQIKANTRHPRVYVKRCGNCKHYQVELGTCHALPPDPNHGWPDVKPELVCGTYKEDKKRGGKDK